MEWTAPAIVLAARPYGEGDALATVMTAGHGAHRGLAKGGTSRGKAATWQPGNLLEVRWAGRLSDQLGSFTAELVHPAAALAMDDRVALAVLSSACAVAEGALGEREPHPRVFAGLVELVAGLAEPDAVERLVRWELVLLAELGYGLDLSACALTGSTAELAWVSPRTGRAVSEAAAEPWRGRLLPLPRFLLEQDAPADAAALGEGLRLSAHFLARDAFGSQHRGLPAARVRLEASLAGHAPAR